MGRKSAAEMATMGPKIRLRSLIAGAYSPEVWLRRFKNLNEADQFRIWCQVEPKEVKMDQSSTFRLVISGLPNKVIDATVIDNKALDEHIDDE
jgi:hypothetical protein